jgi:glycosyltransferase involved in cell wall biosynthesis
MDFVIIANAWSASVDNPTSKHQVALELARQGHRVLWVENAGMRTPSIGSGADRSRIMAKLSAGMAPARLVAPGIWHIVPIIAPVPSLAIIRRLNAWIIRRRIMSALAGLAFVQPALINFMPIVPDVLKQWPWRKVYYCVDRWDRFSLYDSGVMGRLDRECCEYADVVIASSGDLYQRCRLVNPNSFLITHGVDFERFSKSLNAVLSSPMRPADLPDGRIIGFIGLISEWVDQDLLVSIAREIPEARVVMIGKADVDIERLKKEPNIYILGSKPFSALLTYVSWFGVGIIPFAINELTRAVNPIKLREMLAAGCPVVSTALPEVEKYGSGGVTEYGSDGVLGYRSDRKERPTSNNQRSTSNGEGVEQGARLRAEDSATPRQAERMAPDILNTEHQTLNIEDKQSDNLAQQSDSRSDGETHVAGGVAIAGNHDEFIRLVKERLEHSLTLKQKRLLSNSMKDETWAVKAQELVRLVANG